MFTYVIILCSFFWPEQSQTHPPLSCICRSPSVCRKPRFNQDFQEERSHRFYTDTHWHLPWQRRYSPFRPQQDHLREFGGKPLDHLYTRQQGPSHIQHQLSGWAITSQNSIPRSILHGLGSTWPWEFHNHPGISPSPFHPSPDLTHN